MENVKYCITLIKDCESKMDWSEYQTLGPESEMSHIQFHMLVALESREVDSG